MKIKRDFITNSSSTSFLIAFKGSFDEKKILKAFGVKRDSFLIEFFEDFLYSIKDSIKKITKNELSKCDKATLEKIEELQKSGKNVYYGALGSDGEILENFFCQDSFLIETEEIYFNGQVNAW